MTMYRVMVQWPASYRTYEQKLCDTMALARVECMAWLDAGFYAYIESITWPTPRED